MKPVEEEDKCRMVIEWWKGAKKEYNSGSNILGLREAQKLVVQYRMIVMTDQLNKCLGKYPNL
jgi:hypothetical protein